MSSQTTQTEDEIQGSIPRQSEIDNQRLLYLIELEKEEHRNMVALLRSDILLVQEEKAKLLKVLEDKEKVVHMLEGKLEEEVEKRINLMALHKDWKFQKEDMLSELEQNKQLIGQLKEFREMYQQQLLINEFLKKENQESQSILCFMLEKNETLQKQLQFYEEKELTK